MTGCKMRRRVAVATSLLAVCLAVSGAGRPAGAQTPPLPAPVPRPGPATEEVEVPSFLRLSDAIRIAMAGSTQLGSRQAQLAASRKARTASIFALGPDLNAQAVLQRATRTDFDVTQTTSVPTNIESVVTTDGDTLTFGTNPVDQTVDLGDVDETSKFKQVQISSSIRLFDGFANYYRIGAANNAVRSDEFDAMYTSTVVQATVIESYYNLLRAQLLLDVAEDAVKVSQEQLDRTQALYELGSAARSDVLKSQVQLGQTRLTLVQARNGERQGRANLVHSMNLFHQPDFGIDTTLATIPEETVDFDAEVQFARNNRLDVQSLREVEKAQGKRVVVARGPLLPSLDFSYDVAYTDQESQFRFGAQKTRNRSWAFFANWNVFDRYQVYANISQAKANQRVAEYNRRQVELDAVREIREFVNEMQEARERYTVARENVERSREDLRLAQEKFRVGAGTILDVTTAESDLTTTRASEVQAIVDYRISRARLNRATGRPLAEL
ncbi:MAG TPA: TolC family protein [Candidatus Krumholzibacteria bacterium]|nr:TolC family protein [Candidatus Krumholzibacteria bacterium]